MLREIEGKIVEIIFHNKTNGYTVAVFELKEPDDTEEYFNVVGIVPAAATGKNYRLEGKFVTNPKYGEQFSISTCEELMPTTEDGIKDFLSSGTIKGVGRRMARAIVERFGEDTFDIIANDPEQLLEISGVGPKMVTRITEAYKNHVEYAQVIIELRKLGIPTASIVRIYNLYGAEAVEIIRENPYRLTEDGLNMSFIKADEIAKNVGIEGDNEFRIKCGIKYTLVYFAGEGNTYLPEDELCEKTAKLLDQSRELVLDQIEALVFDGDISLDSNEGQRIVYLSAYYSAEKNVSYCLMRLAKAKLKPVEANSDTLIQRAEAQSGISLSEQQKLAVTSCLNEGVSVITGGPGTGKTTIINSIIQILEDSQLKVAIAAPTGRAAKRITETSGKPASTIHRLLEYSFFENGGDDRDRRFMVFGRNEENPLDYDAIIIDEASMIDIILMNGLMKAIRPGTRLIMVGDQDQLPS
ncbi:MAG: AAA family ATPase, partial [Bacillota bacterium]|nr:AAA family ATPase [Bacillota bacterium]